MRKEKHMSNISDFSAKVGNEKRNTSKYEGLTLKTDIKVRFIVPQ